MIARHSFSAMVIAFGLMASVNTLMADTPVTPPEPKAKAGPWALLFQVKSELSLAPLQGSRFSVQRDMPGGDAIRFGVGISAISAERSEAGTDESDAADVDISADYVHYPYTRQDVSLFMGAGPAIGYAASARMETATDTIDTVPVMYELKTDSDVWYVGLHMLVGAEWLLTEHIALTGEYSTSALYEKTDATRVGKRRLGQGEWLTLIDDHYKETGWSFGEVQVKLGLTIYL